eukprot:56883-Pelagomonas_calceolata.AAC.2
MNVLSDKGHRPWCQAPPLPAHGKRGSMNELSGFHIEQDIKRKSWMMCCNDRERKQAMLQGASAARSWREEQQHTLQNLNHDPT